MPSVGEIGIARPAPLALGRLWPLFYIIHVLVTGVISGAVNAAIAVGLYMGQDNIRLWYFPHPLAGDAAVTVFIQCVLGWLIEGMLSFGDFQKRLLPPFPKLAMILGRSRLGLFFLDHSLQLLRGARNRDPKGRHRKTWRLRRILGGIIRAILCAAVVFAPFWGVTVGIAAGVWGNGYIHHTPGPQVFKGIEGLALGIIGSSFILALVGAQCAKFGDGVNPPCLCTCLNLDGNATEAENGKPDSDAPACPSCTFSSFSPHTHPTSTPSSRAATERSSQSAIYGAGTPASTRTNTDEVTIEPMP